MLIQAPKRNARRHREKSMKLPRRAFLHLAAGAAALPVASRIAWSQTQPLSDRPTQPLAERLAAYADGLRYDDLDAATIERVKSHVIDTLGCGIAAFDERPVRICREIVLATSSGASTVIGTNRRATPDLAAFANGAAFRYYDMNDAYVGRVTGHPSDHIAGLSRGRGGRASELSGAHLRHRARL
jgi:2-methylcitrate dehydratase